MHQQFNIQQLYALPTLYYVFCRAWHKKSELLKNPTKIEEIQGKKKLLIEIEPFQLAF